jgi:hypothetical protein
MAVVSMADVMKQFDANGNQIAQGGTIVASLTRSMNMPGIQDPNNGFLATGGGK